MKSKTITQTLKEVSENKYIQGVHIINGIDICEASRECFIEGAKWQQEYLLSLDKEELVKTDNDKLLYQAGVLKGMLRKIELQNKERIYTEKDMKESFIKGALTDLFNTCDISDEDMAIEKFQEWFEQFKNK